MLLVSGITPLTLSTPPSPPCRPPQEMLRNKARNGQNCCLLEEAYSTVSSLPQRSENTHHVAMIENYPATLGVLGEPIRQVRTAEPLGAGGLVPPGGG